LVMKLWTLLAFSLGHYIQVASLITRRGPHPNAGVIANSSEVSVGFVSNSSHNLTSKHANSTIVTIGGYGSYAACHTQPNGCVINTQKVAAELGARVVLFFGCSLDIYAVDYFCKAANAPVSGFTRLPGNTDFAAGNLAWCRIGGLVLAYSFNPGATGPPYFKECDKVLKGPCANVNSNALIQQSVAKVYATFGVAPTAIVVDSSLWDVANWWARDGFPPEPYVAPLTHLARWCQNDFPSLLHWIQMTSPTTKVAFRTAPRVEFMAGYGHSMTNIDAMNSCLRSSSLGNLMGYKMIDYNEIVELILMQQGGPPSNYFEDAFHPGVLPSVIYVDWVLQWAKDLPLGR